jgi:hypothetical protein
MKGKIVTIYGVYDTEYSGELDLVSCEAFERLTTYHVPSRPNWLGCRTIFRKPNRHFSFSPEEAIEKYLCDCRDSVRVAQESLTQARRTLKHAEAFKSGWVRGRKICAAAAKRAKGARQ